MQSENDSHKSDSQKSVNLITVIPLSKSRALDTLSYFTASKIELGSIVTVPIRNKNISALVIESKSVTDMKS